MPTLPEISNFHTLRLFVPDFSKVRSLVLLSLATMKVATLALVAVLCCVVAVSEAARKPHFPFSNVKVPSNAALDHRLPPYSTNWYTQTLDHFNFANTGTFQQRYLVVGTFPLLNLSAPNHRYSDFLDLFVV